jgi:anti-anti-sigma factor
VSLSRAVSMNMHDPESADEVTYQCPVCGRHLIYEPSVPRFDAPCPGCGCQIWCRRRVSSGGAVLEVLPQRTPEPWDVQQVIESLIRSGAAPSVVVDLSQLDTVDSSFVARLVSMNKHIRSAGGRFILCGLRPVVREVFQHLRLDKAFEVRNDPADAT